MCVSLFAAAFYRPYITRLQMGQFVVMMGQAVYDMVAPSSQYPREVAAFLFFYMISMLALFGNFYSKAYTKHQNKPKPASNFHDATMRLSDEDHFI